VSSCSIYYKNTGYAHVKGGYRRQTSAKNAKNAKNANGWHTFIKQFKNLTISD